MPQGGAGAGSEAAAPPASQEYNLQLPGASQKPSAAAAADAAGVGSGGGIARGTENRIVDATAQITLGADTDEVQDVANRVVDVTDRYDGVVSTSEVTKDTGGAHASFELEIPYKHLDAALADLSGLADVISRTQGGKDITAHAVRAQKSLARTLDQIRQARVDLIRADTHVERLVIKSRIASLQANANAEQTALNGVKRQGRFATVGVEVTSGGVELERRRRLGPGRRARRRGPRARGDRRDRADQPRDPPPPRPRRRPDGLRDHPHPPAGARQRPGLLTAPEP